MATNNNSRAGFGQIFVNHRGHPIPTSVGSRSYEGVFGGGAASLLMSKTGNIPAGYAHRPDLISDLFMNSASSWWYICEGNSIFDVFEQLKTGDAIRLPGR